MNRSRVILLIENMSFPRDPRVRREAAALRQSGCDVSVVCPRGPGDEARSFATVDGVKVYRYPQPWQGNGTAGYLLEYGWAMMCTLVLLCRIWVAEGFDVLHAANPPDLFCVIAWPFTLLGKQFVYDQHDLCPELLGSRLSGSASLRRIVVFFEKLSYRLAKLVIVPNQSAYEIALLRGARKGRVCIVRNGPDLESFEDAAMQPALKGDARYLALYVGTIAPQDGVDRVVRAAEHIVHGRGRTDVKVAIAGDGDSVAALRSLARALRVEEHVEFCGWVEGAEFQSYLTTADVCLAPEPPDAFNQRSSFSKLTDYMLCGKATIAFDLVESRRTLGGAGVLVERDDTALFGDAILEVLDDAGRREELGRVAADRLRRYFHWGLAREVLLRAYETVIWNGAALGDGDEGVTEAPFDWDAASRGRANGV
jgi:glycosyltransferase involved in cell wall biosynthesis